MNEYVLNQKTCRSRFLVSYFGENSNEDCGHCDICLSQNSKNSDGLSKREEKIREFIISTTPTLHEFEREFINSNSDAYIQDLRWLSDHGFIKINEKRRLEWVKK